MDSLFEVVYCRINAYVLSVCGGYVTMGVSWHGT